MTPELEAYAHHEDTILIDELSTPAIHTMIREMKKPGVHAGIYLHPDVEKLKSSFCKKFTILSAAGTLTVSENGNILMIHRRDKWDLPKGKCESKEKMESCALRETMEETGLHTLHLQSYLTTTYHTYEEDGNPFWKETRWYRCAATEQQELHPQISEQITQIDWVHPKNLAPYISNTFPSIIDVLQAGGLL